MVCHAKGNELRRTPGTESYANFCGELIFAGLGYECVHLKNSAKQMNQHTEPNH